MTSDSRERVGWFGKFLMIKYDVKGGRYHPRIFGRVHPISIVAAKFILALEIGGDIERKI